MVQYILYYTHGAANGKYAVILISVALNHPERVFSECNTSTYAIYGIYALAVVMLFVAPFKGKGHNTACVANNFGLN